MYMVTYSAYFDGDAIHSLDDSSDILKYTGKVFTTHVHTCCLHMEYEVDVYFCN